MQYANHWNARPYFSAFHVNAHSLSWGLAWGLILGWVGINGARAFTRKTSKQLTCVQGYACIPCQQLQLACDRLQLGRTYPVACPLVIHRRQLSNVEITMTLADSITKVVYVYTYCIVSQQMHRNWQHSGASAWAMWVQFFTQMGCWMKYIGARLLLTWFWESIVAYA